MDFDFLDDTSTPEKAAKPLKPPSPPSELPPPEPDLLPEALAAEYLAPPLTTSPSPARSTAASIKVMGLTKRYGSFTAVDGVSFTVPEGSFFGYLGTNGAGKSTTIKMLAGMMRPSSGTARVLGLDVARSHVEVKRRVGVVPEESALFEWLTGREYLTFVGRIHGMERAVIERRTAELFHMLDMEEKSRTLINEYSKGMKKKVALAAALLYNPRILFLDEPFEGVDVVTTHLLRSLLRELTERGVTIFLTSHIIEIVQRLCTDFVIISHGKVLQQGELSEGRVLGDAAGRTLEQLFLDQVTDAERQSRHLTWLDEFGPSLGR